MSNFQAGTNLFKKSKGPQSRINSIEVATSRKLEFAMSPFNSKINVESSGESPFISESIATQEPSVPFTSSRRLDFEKDKENIDPMQNKRNKLNIFMVSRPKNEETNDFLDLLSLRRNQTDAPMDVEGPIFSSHNSNTDQAEEFSLKEYPRKNNSGGSFADFSMFKISKLRSDHSERSSGNFDFFTNCLPTFEETKESLYPNSSQPCPINDEEEIQESRFEQKDVDSTKDTSDCCISDIPEPYTPLLSLIKNLKNPDLNHITPETLVELICSNRPYLIVDCRYDYEYEGGHIKGAINIRSPEMLERVFFTYRHHLQNSNYLQQLKDNFEGVICDLDSHERYPNNQETPIIIFHCEFSQKRGPRALRALRSMDREINQAKWPMIFYPEVYVLEGGYRGFYGNYGENCVPEFGYVEMTEKTMKKEYISNKAYETKHWKKKNSYNLGGSSLPGLFRAKTTCEF